MLESNKKCIVVFGLFTGSIILIIKYRMMSFAKQEPPSEFFGVAGGFCSVAAGGEINQNTHSG